MPFFVSTAVLVLLTTVFLGVLVLSVVLLVILIAILVIHSNFLRVFFLRCSAWIAFPEF